MNTLGKIICYAVLLIIISSVNIYAGQSKKIDNDEGSIDIKYNNNIVISAEIYKAKLSDVLSEIESKAGVKINIDDKSILDRIVTVSLKESDVESLVKSILHDNYILVSSKPTAGDSYRIKEIGIVGKSNKPSRKVITREFAYGSGKENVGAIRAGEGANIGPGSFAVDKNGNIYICDTVNKRVQVVMSDGDINTISLNEVIPSDIAVGADGNIYIYDSNGKLISYDQSGKKINTLTIDETRWDSRGPMRIVNNEIFVRGSGRGDVLVARIENGTLVSPSDLELKRTTEEGFYGQNGRRYIASLLEGDSDGEISGLSLEISDREGVSTSHSVNVEGIISVEFIGEDGNGNTYLKTEEINDDIISVEVSEFDSEGNLFESIPVPGNDYEYWSIRTVLTGEDGSIYHMMPGREKMTLNKILPN